jgi:DNA-binding NarL/FixJ family response regulator
MTPSLRDRRVRGRHPQAPAPRAADRAARDHTPRHALEEVLLMDARQLAEDASDAPAVLPDGGQPVVTLLDELRKGLRARLHALLAAGVSGFVSTRDDSATLLEAFHAAVRGDGVYLSPRLAARLANPDGSGSTRLGNLTRRERSVLAHAALGHNNDRIATDFGMAKGTVRNHLSAVYTKLGVRTRTEAVVWAWRHGLVHDDGTPAEPRADG